MYSTITENINIHISDVIITPLHHMSKLVLNKTYYASRLRENYTRIKIQKLTFILTIWVYTVHWFPWGISFAPGLPLPCSKRCWCLSSVLQILKAWDDCQSDVHQTCYRFPGSILAWTPRLTAKLFLKKSTAILTSSVVETGFFLSTLVSLWT